MSDKLDLDIDVTQLAFAPLEILAALRVGQRLSITLEGEEEHSAGLCTESGVRLAPLPEPQVAARFPNPTVIIRAIKREAQKGAIQKFQVRLYRADATGWCETRRGRVIGQPH